MAQDYVMSDNDFCKMIHDWTKIDLTTPVGAEQETKEEKESDNRPTIGELLREKKELFFVFARANEKQNLKILATECGLNGLSGFSDLTADFVALKAIEVFGNSKRGR